MRPPVTSAAIAAHLQLSKATVAHVLNGRGTSQRIRPETQQRVLEAARQLGYRPNLSARATRTGRFGCAALIQSLKGEYLPTDLLQGIVESLGESDMHLSLAEVPDEVIAQEAFLPKIMRELMADGLLINRILDTPPYFSNLIQSLRMPAILLNVKQDADCVHPDDLGGGRLATEHLLQLRHTRIVYVQAALNAKEHYSWNDRRWGYEAAMRAAGLEPQIWTLPPDPWTPEQYLSDRRIVAAQEYLSGPAQATAVITYEMGEALAIAFAAHRLRLRIPEDLAILMFHWGREASACLPFTVVTNAIRRVGREGVQMLIAKIEDPDEPQPRRVIPVELLEGGTTGPHTR